MKYKTIFISCLIQILLCVSCSEDTGCFFIDNTTESVEIICEYTNGKDSEKDCYSWDYGGSSWNAHKAKIKVLIVHNCRGGKMNEEYFENFPNVKVLDVSFFGLEYLKSEALNMKYLEKFNASHNKLHELSGSAFINLPSLVEADFSFNKISTLDATTFTIFQKLKKLDLSNNRIEIIDGNLFENNNELELLRLDNNPIQTFEFLSNLMESTSVTITLDNVLRLDTSSLGSSVEAEIGSGDAVIFRLPKSNSTVLHSTKSFENLIYLNISGNELKNTAKVIDLLGSSIETLDASSNFMEKLSVQTFAKFTDLRWLNLKNTNISTIDFDSFQNVSFSTYNEKLESVNLEDNPIRRFDCNMFTMLKRSVAVQVSCKHTEDLDSSCMGDSITLNFNADDISFGFVENIGASSKLKCPKSFLQNLKYLNLSNNALGNTTEILNSLGASIKILDISSNFVGNFNADLFQQFTNLKYLNLRQTQLKKVSSVANHHLPFYRNDAKLIELHIDQNPITRLDCNMVLLLVSSNSAKVSWEDVKEIDTSCMGDLLQFDLNEEENGVIFRTDGSEFHCPKEQFQKLIYFNISGNHLNNTSKVVHLLGPALQTLDASSNFIGKLSEKTFKQLNNVQHLNISNTNLSNFGFNTFYRQRKLEALDLSFNRLGKVDFNLFLRNFKSLNALNLEGNNLTEIDSVTRLNFPKLTALGISKNQFTCNYLAIFLRQWESLKLFHNPSDQTHIDGVDCYHEDQNANENQKSNEWMRKEQEIKRKSQNTETLSKEQSGMTGNEKLDKEAETLETSDTVSTVEKAETAKSLETTTTIENELYSEETPTNHDISSSTATNKAVIVDYQNNIVAEQISRAKSATNEHSPTEKIVETTKLDTIKSNDVYEQSKGHLLYLSDTSNSILTELRFLKYILLILLVLCVMYFVVKIKLVQRIKGRMANIPREGSIVYRHDARNGQHCIELIEHTENTLKEYN